MAGRVVPAFGSTGPPSPVPDPTHLRRAQKCPCRGPRPRRSRQTPANHDSRFTLLTRGGETSGLRGHFRASVDESDSRTRVEPPAQRTSLVQYPRRLFRQRFQTSLGLSLRAESSSFFGQGSASPTSAISRNDGFCNASGEHGMIPTPG